MKGGAHLSPFATLSFPDSKRGWSGGAMVLGKLPVPRRPTIWITVGQGPTALVVGAGGGCLDIFTLIYPFSPLSPSLWETARCRLKYCLKGPLNPKQPTNPDSKKVTITVWLTVRVFWSSNGEARPRIHDLRATFCTIIKPL